MKKASCEGLGQMQDFWEGPGEILSVGLGLPAHASKLHSTWVVSRNMTPVLASAQPAQVSDQSTTIAMEGPLHSSSGPCAYQSISLWSECVGDCSV